MLAVERIALAEFARSVGPRRSGAPGSRDFRWLSIFHLLSAFLLFIGIAAQAGTRHRFEQVLLGALPASGPPIRLGAHIDRPEALTPDLLAQLKRDFPYLVSAPTREFDGQSGVLLIPGFDAAGGNAVEPNAPGAGNPPAAAGSAPGASHAQASEVCQRLKEKGVAWHCSKEGEFAEFRGLAISRQSPLWRWIETMDKPVAASADGAPPALVVAASRAMFDKHFQYDRYRLAVADNIRAPCRIRDALQRSSGFTTMVLRLRESMQRDEAFHVVRVIWVDSLPIDRVAMMVPLEDYEMLLATEGRKNVSLHADALGLSEPRVTKIFVRDVDLLETNERDRLVPGFRAFATCLGAIDVDANPGTPARQSCGVPVYGDPSFGGFGAVPRLIDSSLDVALSVSGDWGLRVADVLACARKAGIADELGPDPAAGLPSKSRLSMVLTDPSTVVRWKSPARLEMPCDMLGRDDPGANGCAKGGMGEAQLAGYRETFMYLPPRKGGIAAADDHGLDAVVSALTGWQPDRRPVFRLDPAYEGSLVRFGVLSTIIDRISTPIGIGALIMYLFLAFVIIMTTFAHRRPQYGLLLMNGMRGVDVARLVLWQIFFAAVVGGIWGIATFGLVHGEVNALLSSDLTIIKAQKLIGLDMPIFLDVPSVSTLLLAWSVMAGVTVVVGCLVLLLQGVINAKAPISLLKS